MAARDGAQPSGLVAGVLVEVLQHFGGCRLVELSSPVRSAHRPPCRHRRSVSPAPVLSGRVPSRACHRTWCRFLCSWLQRTGQWRRRLLDDAVLTEPGLHAFPAICGRITSRSSAGSRRGSRARRRDTRRSPPSCLRRAPSWPRPRTAAGGMPVSLAPYRPSNGHSMSPATSVAVFGWIGDGVAADRAVPGDRRLQARVMGGIQPHGTAAAAEPGDAQPRRVAAIRASPGHRRVEVGHDRRVRRLADHVAHDLAASVILDRSPIRAYSSGATAR